MADWTRPAFQPTTRHAELMYLVVGASPKDLKINRERHHVSQIEPNLTVTRHFREKDPKWFEGWFDKVLGHGLDRIFGPDAETVRSAEELSVIRGKFDEPKDLAYLRNSVGVVSALLEGGALAVFDALAVRWWRPDAWRAAFVDRSEFRVGEHTAISVSEEPSGSGGGLWVHTRGMKKFARPDLQVRHVPGPYDEHSPMIRHAAQLLDRIAERLAQGAVIVDGQKLVLEELATVVSFRLCEDDTQTARHFNNAAIEIQDINPQTNQPEPGIARVLEALGARARPM